MTDEELMQRESRDHSPVELAEILRRALPDGLTQGTLVTFFFRAFPKIPLKTLLDAVQWKGLGGSLTDDELNRSLSPGIHASRSTAQ